MVKKVPFHPLLFALSPLLFLLAWNSDPLLLGAALRQGAIWLAGGLGLLAVFWAITRHWARAALLASLCLLLIFLYDPAYELVRGRALMGFTYGKHRYLAPLWAALLAAGIFAVFRKVRQPQRLTPVFNAAGALMLGAGLVSVSLAGMWAPALRFAGLLPPPRLEVTYINVGQLGSEASALESSGAMEESAGPPEAGAGATENGAAETGGVVGDSILLRTAEGKNMLIDGGYPNDLVVETLQSQGVDHLDVVVLTHAHDDHTGGLIDVFQSLPVDLFIHNGQALDTPVFAAMEKAFRESGAAERVVRAGDRVALGSLTFDVLSPLATNPSNINNGSVVLRLEIGEVSFLFTGDTDQLEERRLLAAGLTEKVNILKLAHHGADTSSLPAYIAAISPEIAIYSAGAGNMHNLPHDVTLETMREAGAVIYGTDHNGTITVRTDGRTYEVITERSGPLFPPD